jgi:hypothetical protein
MRRHLARQNLPILLPIRLMPRSLRRRGVIAAVVTFGAIIFSGKEELEACSRTQIM